MSEPSKINDNPAVSMLSDQKFIVGLASYEKSSDP